MSTLRETAPGEARVEALRAIVAVLAARPLAAPGWIRAEVQGRLSKALAASAVTKPPGLRAA